MFLSIFFKLTFEFVIGPNLAQLSVIGPKVGTKFHTTNEPNHGSVCSRMRPPPLVRPNFGPDRVLRNLSRLLFWFQTKLKSLKV